MFSVTILMQLFFVITVLLIVAICLSQCYVCVLSRVRPFVTPWTVALPGSSVRGIAQARILEWVAISSSRDVCVYVYMYIHTDTHTHTHTHTYVYIFFRYVFPFAHITFLFLSFKKNTLLIRTIRKTLTWARLFNSFQGD